MLPVLPLVPLRTGGYTAVEEEETPEWDGPVQWYEPEDVKLVTEEQFLNLFGEHAPFQSTLAGVACRSAPEDMKMLALSLWTNDDTFRLISAFHAFRNRRYVGVHHTMVEFFQEHLRQASSQLQASTATLLLFFAPDALRDMLPLQAAEFAQLGCVFARRGARSCVFSLGLLMPETAALEVLRGQAHAPRIVELGQANIRAGTNGALNLVRAAENVAKAIDTLWVEVAADAGPVYRGDATPGSWLDTGTPVQFPVSTSMSAVVAFSFRERATPDSSPAGGGVFAILLAKGARCIDVNRRFGNSGAWMNCHKNEREVLVHPDTIFRSPRRLDTRDGSVALLVGDVINDRGWRASITNLYTEQRLPPPSLDAFRQKLVSRAFGDARLFEEYKVVVGFPARGRRGVKRSAEWTSLSVLERFLHT
jgi:hypothetical protein